MKKAKSLIWLLAPYLYLALPVIIFFGTWVRWYIALPAIFIIFYCLYRIMQASAIPQLPQERTRWMLLGIFAIILVWVYLSGIGKMTFQNGDHGARNTLFEGLVTHSWPIIGSYDTGAGSSTYALVYYIGFWLPAAFIGKLTGSVAIGYFIQILWAALGIFLFYLLYCSYCGKLQHWPLIVFIFFSGLDVVGYYIYGNDLSTVFAQHLEIWCEPFQFSSFTTQLFWTFNQAIPIWLALMLLLVQKNNRFTVFILGLIPLSSTLPFIGILPIAAYLVLSRMYDTQTHHLQFRSWIQETFTLENILGGGICGILSFLYLKSNTFGSISTNTPTDTSVSESVVTHFWGTGFFRGFLFILLSFLFIEIFIYYIAIHKYQHRNPLYIISLLTLVLCPLLHIGSANDFCMRASIPSLVILWMLVVDSIRQSILKKDVWITRLIILLLLIGSITPLQEFHRTITQTQRYYFAQAEPYQPTGDIEGLLGPGNFAGDTSQSFFFKYLAQ